MRPGMAVWCKDARGNFAFVFPGIARVAHALAHSPRPVLLCGADAAVCA